MLKVFENYSEHEKIKSYFIYKKTPFVIRNLFQSNVDLKFLRRKYSDYVVNSLNNNSIKEKISIFNLINKVKKGQKYRLRANTLIGNKIFKHVDTSIIDYLRDKQSNFLDYLLSHGETSRQKTLFLSTKGCTFSKHAHVISGMIFQLEGTKTWYISKTLDNFFSIRFKSFLNPNPLYVTDKDKSKEARVLLYPGDFLYIPAYWFHYTNCNETSLSMSYFFTEKLNYYLKKTPLLFLFQAFRNPIQTIYKSLNKEPEDHIFDKMNILRKCYKIKNKYQRRDTIEFFRSNDFS